MFNLAKYKKLTSVILFLVLIGIAGSLVYLVQRNQAPVDSDAIFGGKSEAGYPEVGYLFSIYNETKIKSCGGILISDDTVLSAAHCIPEEDTVVRFGLNTFSLNSSDNNKVIEAALHPQYKSAQLQNDLAIIKLEDRLSAPQAEIVSPKIGCDYIVVGYGLTEDDNSDGSNPLRSRKSADICIKEISSTSILITGKDGGVCFGDSGSPILKKDTNEVVGILSAIVSTSNKDVKCAVNNTAVALRLDYYSNYISSYVENEEIDLQIANENQFCSVTDSIVCNANLSCIRNLCAIDTYNQLDLNVINIANIVQDAGLSSSDIIIVVLVFTLFVIIYLIVRDLRKPRAY